MFIFIVKYFSFLKFIPLLPQLFDSQLRLWAVVVNPAVIDCIDDIEKEVLSWDGTRTKLHKYGGLQFNCSGSEIGHIHSNGILDIRFNQKIKEQLVEQGRISNHHVFTNSGWVSFRITGRQDMGYAKGLLKMAYQRATNNLVRHA
jgi:hypothetical protein